ncbi:MAG: helix-turn-helix transcriptional regulator [Phycisphaerae bacterium]
MKNRVSKKQNKLREIREKKSMALQELSVTAGVSLSMLVGVEKYGYYPKSADIKRRIATALKVNESDIWTETTLKKEIA